MRSITVGRAGILGRVGAVLELPSHVMVATPPMPQIVAARALWLPTNPNATASPSKSTDALAALG